MPDLNIFDQSYTPYTSDTSVRNLVNFYMEENLGGGSNYKFLNTPGSAEYLNLSGTSIRGCFEHKNVGYVVRDDKVYSVVDGSPPTSTQIGTLNTSTGRVSIAATNIELLFADGTNVWSFLPATSTWAEVTDVDLPANVSYVCAHLGYFIAVKPEDDQFFVSALNDGTSWNSLDFASTELDYDNLVAAVPVNQSVWMLGERSTELWWNDGSATGAPYDRRSGGAHALGCAAPFSALRIHADLFYLAQNESGLLGIVRANESGFQIISTRPMLEKFNSYTDISNAFAWSYTINTHEFYVITFPDADSNRGRTWQYDLSTNKWNELESYNEDNPLVQPQTRHFANCRMYLNRKLIVGDFNSGTLYELSSDYTDENGYDINREITSINMKAEDKVFTLSNLVLDVEDDIETETVQPKVGLQISKDYGNTWTSESVRSVGLNGVHKTKSMWSRLGRSKVFTLKFVFSGAVKWSVLSVRAKVRVYDE